MYLLLSITSILLAVQGIYRSYKKKNMIIFIWLIVFYYTITSLVAALFPGSSITNVQYVSIETKTIYIWSVLLCIAGFTISDLLFNKKQKNPTSLGNLNCDRKIFTALEIVYWISLLITFSVLNDIDYVEYNTNNKGGGWAQCFFQLSACVNFVFVYKKEYIKLLISLLIVLAIVAFIHVRSFLFFPLMPIVFYFLYKGINSIRSFKGFAIKTAPMVIILFLFAAVMGIMRFGRVSLPETELTEIAFASLDDWSFGRQYIASIAHYIYRFFGLFINILSHLGINTSNPLDFYPSVPRLNAMILSNVSDVSLLENASHMPATIFFDLYISWGYYCGLVAIGVYWFFIKVFDLLQRDLFTLVLFSAIMGWHFYMLLRGAVDTCSAGINYAFWMALVILVIRNLTKFKSLSKATI